MAPNSSEYWWWETWRKPCTSNMRGLHSDTEASPEPSEKKYFTIWHDKTNKQMNNDEKTRNTWKQTAHSVILRSQRCHLICSEKMKICINEANIGTQTLDNKASFEDLHRHWQSDHLASIWEGKSFLIRRGPVPLPWLHWVSNADKSSQRWLIDL